ncbi:TPA: tRNA pseudouridine(13) synthase TruD [Providencia stuartii]|uniref:tRNA pseudouridine(13) synthase TruD n=1 Tax=Providencia stuartii TaxID=588 RepID=UPI00198033F6|nr:tRNA pseudouridine(13) synthase TruD [Providencia stuartii]MBN5593632.1 tRNA pseudouridine(13) synthase TruD [Providencia stuartii]HEM6908007.1 tRNA pseudouridine(13) synthase TruD [Providencia stuartii]HEM7155058.1 tRNA pseudouridine(13) synthase TruD [Providencia stuartii]HEM7523394.1 tRNA pseudouridine(13) synthase TruD [Providencia stuartii]HEM8204099.1 tRNA pseudouridine(13) synthase TruD [Providencia stuartii]
MKLMNVQYLHGKPLSTGKLKSQPEDFIVKEDLGFELDGEGEHVMVRIEKTGCNTLFVAEQLAKFAKISARSVSYAGLKDRNAVTEQWFCLQMPGKETPDFSLWQLDGCRVIATTRQKRKLRIGTLKGNQFELTIRDISVPEDVEARLQKVAEQGIPNYFGEQRFGRDGQNLTQALRWANQEITVRERNKRSFYLSAARSAMFNHVASERIENQTINQVLLGDALQLTGRGSWFVATAEELPTLQARVASGELSITAPLPGDGELGTQEDALVFETNSLESYHSLMTLMKNERVSSTRRAMIAKPQNLQWQWIDQTTLKLNFFLNSGSFATSVVREIINQDSADVKDIIE